MPTAVGLTTLENLRLHVWRDATDDTRDDKLTFYGESMSEAVADYCQREFIPPDDDPVTRTFNYDGDGTLDVSPYEFRSVTSVVLHSDQGADSERELTANEYRLSPRGGTKQGTYLALDLIVPRLGPVHYGFDWSVALTGFWGMETVPKPIELAVLIAVDDVINNPGSYASQQLGGYTIVSDPLDPSFAREHRGGLPRAALYRCNPYKRRRAVESIQLAHPTTARWPWPSP